MAASRSLSVLSLSALFSLTTASTTAKYVSRSDLTPPYWDVTYSADASAGALADGYTFIAPSGDSNPVGLIIVDNDGELVWQGPSDLGQRDFDVQAYKGEPYLTYWGGDIDGAGFSTTSGKVYMMDSAYDMKCSSAAEDGSDFHEFSVNQDGSGSVITTHYTQENKVDLRGIETGTKKSWIVESCFQEFDMESGEPSFKFCASEDGISFFDSYVAPTVPPVLKATAWDFAHLNSVTKDAAGNFLLSARYTHALYYISSSSSDILWRLGGMNSTFTMLDNTNFAGQHHARFIGEQGLSGDEISALTTRRISIYDNEFDSPSTAYADESRGLILEINLESMEASYVQSYHNPGGQTLLSQSQGSLQVLSEVPGLNSDNVLMSYGALPVIAEYTADGTALQVVNYSPDGNQGYRVFKNEWTGAPRTTPDVAVQDDKVYVSWNGDTRTRSWQVLTGSEKGQVNETMVVVDKSGFETSISIEDSDGFIQVEALDAEGNSLAKSDVLNKKGKNVGGGVVGENAGSSMSC